MNQILGVGTGVAKSVIVSIGNSLMVVFLVRDHHSVVLKSGSSVCEAISIVESLVSKFTVFFA